MLPEGQSVSMYSMYMCLRRKQSLGQRVNSSYILEKVDFGVFPKEHSTSQRFTSEIILMITEYIDTTSGNWRS